MLKVLAEFPPIVEVFRYLKIISENYDVVIYDVSLDLYIGLTLPNSSFLRVITATSISEPSLNSPLT